MNKILLSIQPLAMSKIISGEKTFIYRKRAAKQDVQKIVLYCSSPIKKIIGEANLKQILCDTPNKLWAITKNGSGTNKDLFDLYFFNKKVAYAYQIEKFHKYKTPISLEILGYKFPPQFFYYLKD